jgi:hypothetical protein
VAQGHFGAMRGLDFAKNYAAAISIGRSEMPVWVVDGLVAALNHGGGCQGLRFTSTRGAHDPAA